MIGIVGGTGEEGLGLALRFALAGETVIVGSRDKVKAQNSVNSILPLVPANLITGNSNELACEYAEVVIISLPFTAHRKTIEHLRPLLEMKTVIDVTVPLLVNKGIVSVAHFPDGSAALETNRLLPHSKVVSAFHSISAKDLLDPNKSIDADTVICTNHNSAKNLVIALAEKIKGVRAIYGGNIENSQHTQHQTALLVNLNQLYKTRCGVRITGI